MTARPDDQRVVITGMGVVSPIGTSVCRFFDGLARGRSGIGEIRSFDASAFAARLAGEVDDLDLEAVELRGSGDAAAALRRDRKGLFAITAAREAWAGAGGPGAGFDPRRLGLFAGAGLEVFHLQDLVAHVGGAGGEPKVDGASLLAALDQQPPGAYLQIPAHLAARCIADEVGVRGRFGVNVSACAAGTQAVGEALWAIRDGVLDAALAGGYDSMVNPLGVGGFTLLKALSRSNDLGPAASRPFDARRDGFVLGEGAAFCLLEALPHARRRGAPILAEVLGYGASLDAFRLTDPPEDHAGAQVAMSAALADAGLAPGAVGYISAHGTGTPKNDPAECAAIRAVFGEAAGRIPVSSTKSQIGHLIGAAGAVELVASIFALQRGLLPATITLAELDPACQGLDHVAGEPRVAEVEAVVSNSFGFGGQNATLVVGRGPNAKGR